MASETRPVEFEITCECGCVFRHPLLAGRLNEIRKVRVNCPKCGSLRNPWGKGSFLVAKEGKTDGNQE